MFDQIRELWTSVEDDRVPSLGKFYEISSLGRVRRRATEALIRCNRRSVEDGSPWVKLYFREKQKVKRTIYALVRAVWGEKQAAIAVAATTGGLSNLLDLRQATLEALWSVEAAVALVAFGAQEEAGSMLLPNKERPSVRDVALVEAAQLGSALRSSLDVDPVSRMSRKEMLKRLTTLRSLFGTEIEQVSRVNLQTAGDVPQAPFELRLVAS
jgi:hypothetical protein